MAIYDEPDLPNITDTAPALPAPTLPNMGGESAPVVPPAAPETDADSQDTGTLPVDIIGDIPPPPIPAPPTIPGQPAAASALGITAFAPSRAAGAKPFRTPAFGGGNQQLRFGPGVPTAGSADGGDELDMEPDDIGELLRRLASGGGI